MMQCQRKIDKYHIIILIYMNNTSIILNEQSVQECVNNIKLYMECTELRTFTLIVHSKQETLDDKYDVVYDHLPKVLANITLEYIREDIEIPYTINDHNVKISNNTLKINIQLIYKDYLHVFGGFRNITFHNINVTHNILYYMIPLFRYYLSTRYHIEYSFLSKSLINCSGHNELVPMCEQAIHDVDITAFENELLIFKAIFDLIN